MKKSGYTSLCVAMRNCAQNTV